MKQKLLFTGLMAFLMLISVRGWGQTSPISETFSNLGAYSGYVTETWTGDDGGTWTATDARPDQTITGKAICIRNGLLTSPTVSGGIGSLTVKTQRKFSGGTGNMDLRVNGVSVGSIPYDGTVQTTTINNINISGDVIIIIDATNSSSDRPAIDDLSWTAYAGATDPEPTNQPTDFTATANSSSTITTSWIDAAVGTQVPSGYLILANTTGTFSDPVDGTAQTDDEDLSDNVAVKNVAHGSGASYQWATGLSASTQYFFKIYSYNGSGSSINYKTDGTVLTANATTDSPFDNDADVTSLAQPAGSSISSLTDTEGEAMDVFKFDITDWGTSDGLPTKVTNIRIYPAASNTADWTNSIQGIVLSGSTLGAITIGAPSISDTEIDIPISVGNLNVSDFDNEEITLSVYLNTSNILDNSILSFQIDADNHGFTADATGTGFLGEFNSGTNIISNDFTIDVTPTELQFKQQPSNIQTNNSISPAPTVAYTDINGNIDLDLETANIRVTATGATLIGSPVNVAIAANGLATFSTLQFSSSSTGVFLTATDSDDWLETSASVNSSAFDVTNVSSTGKVIISEMCDPQGNYANDRYIEITNIDDVTIDLTGWSVEAIINDGSSVAFTWNLSGTLAPKNSITCGDTDNSIFTPDFAEVDWSTSNSSWNGKDGDGAILYDGSKGIIDDAGSHGSFENDATIRVLSVIEPTTTFNSSEWYTSPVSSPSESTPGFHINEWNGTTNNSWTEITNWSQGVLTKELSHAVIKSSANNMPTILAKANGDVHDLVVEDGASIIGAENLTINGTFTMQRTITNDNGWHLLSAPVGDQTIIGSDFVPNGSLPLTFDFYSFDESESTTPWINIRADESGNVNGSFDAQFVNGKGYLIAYSGTYGNTSFDFTGSVNSGTITTPNLTFNTGTDYEGANLIGNPYPSAIDWSLAIKTQFDDNFAYIYNEAKSGGAGYEEITGTIAPNQGFFVILNSANNGQSFSFTTDIQVDGGSFLKDADANAIAKLRFGNQTNYDEIKIVLNTESELVRDRNDALKLFSFDTQIPQVYAKTSDNVNVAVNSIPEINESAVIPIDIYVPAEGSYYISLSEISGVFSEHTVILEDQSNGLQYDLTNVENYSFVASPSDSPDRFLLHFGAVGIGEQDQASALNAYVYNNRLYINNSLEKAQLAIYDLQGRLVVQQSISEAGLQALPLNLPAGMYVLQLSNAQQAQSVKINVQ